MYNLAIRKCTSPPLLAPRLKIFKLKFTPPLGIEPRTCWTRGRHATIWASAASSFQLIWKFKKVQQISVPVSLNKGEVLRAEMSAFFLWSTWWSITVSGLFYSLLLAVSTCSLVWSDIDYSPPFLINSPARYALSLCCMYLNAYARTRACHLCNIQRVPWIATHMSVN